MKLAIIGTGKIVQEALYAIDSLRSIDTRAIFGRPHSREKARSLADQYRITCVHDPEYFRQLESERLILKLGLLKEQRTPA